MTTPKTKQPAKAERSPELQSAVDNTQVTQLGDVTEKNSPLPPEPTRATEGIRPLSELPEGYEDIAEIYSDAKGFTLEGGTVALHF